MVFQKLLPKKSNAELSVEITISALSHHAGWEGAITPPPSSITVAPGSQRNLGTESKNIHCTYQMLSDSLLATAAETCRTQLVFVFSRASSSWPRLQKGHLPTDSKHFAAAVNPLGASGTTRCPPRPLRS